MNLCFIFKTICRNSNNFPISSVTGITPRNTFNNSWCVILYTPPSHLYLIFEQKSCVNIKNYIYIRRCMLKADIWETYRQKFGKGKLSQVSHLSLSYGEVAWLYLQEEELNFLPLCKFIGEMNVSRDHPIMLEVPELGSRGYSLFSGITY